MATAFDSFEKSLLGAFCQSQLFGRGVGLQRIIGGRANDNIGITVSGPGRIAAYSGSSWSQTLNFDSPHGVKSLARHSASVILGGLAAGPTSQQTALPGLLRSSDNGVNWTATSHGTNNLVVASDGTNCITADDSGGYTGSIYNNTTQTRIRRSIDGGASWTNVFNFPAYLSSGGINYYYCGKAATANAAGIALVGAYAPHTSVNSRVYRSINGGLSWALASATVFGNRIPWCFCDLGGGIILLGTGLNGAIFRTVNSGANWALAATLTTDPRYVTKIVNMGGGVVYAGVNRVSSTVGGTLFRSLDYGATWTLFHSFPVAAGFMNSLARLDDGSLVFQVHETCYHLPPGGSSFNNMGSAGGGNYLWDMII